MKLGIRLGSEYIDVESCWDENIRDEILMHRGISKIISSHHNYKDTPNWSSLQRAFELCYNNGAVGMK